VSSVTSQGATLTVTALPTGGPYQVSAVTPVDAIFSPNPGSLAHDAAGNIYIADGSVNAIYKLTPAGALRLFAGTGSVGSDNGPANTATFNGPLGVAVDAAGSVYVADSGNHKIRKIYTDPVTQALMVRDVAGALTPGYQDGAAANAKFDYPVSMTLDAVGNIYLIDVYNQAIRKITPQGVVSTLAGGNGQGFGDGSGTAVKFNNPSAITIDSAGTLYVADYGNSVIRKVTQQGVVSTFAGQPGVAGTADGTGTSARFSFPISITIDATGVIFVGDWPSEMPGVSGASYGSVRRIDPASGSVTTVAGGNQAGPIEGPGLSVHLFQANGLTANTDGNLYATQVLTPKMVRIAP
jgi:sugar lactone lactonase YvrE